jgi:tetratricopeptide (TPR) repeat protein
MFNPEMMNKMKNMIDGKSMKNMLGNITNMNDDQIRMYLSASGMGHISPQMFRQMAGQMKNMDENELDRMKNMVPNATQAGFPYQANNAASTGNSNQRNTSNSNVKSGHNTDKINSPATSSKKDFNFPNNEPVSKNILDKLEKIKIEGNNFFRSGKYKEACEKYYEILNEMDYISDSEKVTYQKQLDDLEIVCRLNIANTKIKQEDYDLVIHECLKVLKKSENFKAHYRAGVAYFKKKSHQKAYHHLVKAKDLNKEGDVDIDKYLTECKTFLDVIDEEKNKSQINEEKKIDDKSAIEFKSTQNNPIVNNIIETNIISETNEKNNIGEPIELNEIKLNNAENIFNTNYDVNLNETKKTSSKIEKLKEIVHNDVKTESSRDIKIKEDDILVEDKINKNTNFDISQQGEFYYLKYSYQQGNHSQFFK